MLYINLIDLERFEARYIPEPNTGCWLWIGDGSDKYGRFYFNGKLIGAHQFSYLLKAGELDDQLDVHHKCDNTWCVNPDHLEEITHQENVQIAMEKMKRKRKTCKSGLHNWIDENIMIESNGKRRCRICFNETWRRNYHLRTHGIYQ